jgi:beta-glucuronidase
VNDPAHDPFHHLHDEAYARPFESPVLGSAGVVAMAGRRVEPLAGEWNFTLDLFDEGLRQHWYRDPAEPPAQWVRPRDYDALAGQKTQVPSCWTMQRPQWRHFEGGAWYTRLIDGGAGCAEGAGNRTVLRVGAANYQARVFLNGHFLGTHRGGSTPFFVDLTEHLQPGPVNRLQVQVDNRREPQRVPMHHFDWFNHGGLYREVELLRLPAVHFRRAELQLLPDGSFSRLRACLALSAPVDGVAWVELPALGVRQEVPIRQGRGTLLFDARPELWSPEHPCLYDVHFTFGEDRVCDRIGFREIRVEGRRILLNGRPVYLRGICVHEDDLELGKCSTEEDVRRRFAHARELGCNFLRLAHYPHHEHVARLADELGFLLWEEIPVYWAIRFDDPATLDDARNQLQELIARDANRASVILWGVGNENADTEARYAFMRELVRAAREADPTRLVSAACLINRQAFRIEDRLAQHLDVIGLNEYFGWYEPGFEGLRTLLANSSPDRPVLISETGADALAGHHGREDELFTEECQARMYRGQIAIADTADYICGMTPWLLYDFRSERRQTVFNAGFNRKGLIAEDKATRKLAFEVLARAYRTRQARGD